LDADNIFFDKNMALKDDLLYGSIMDKHDEDQDPNHVIIRKQTYPKYIPNSVENDSVLKQPKPLDMDEVEPER